MERRQFGLFRSKTYLKGRYPTGEQADPIKELTFFRGDTVRFELQVFTEEDELLDLTDFDIVFTVKCEEWDDVVLFQATAAADPSYVTVLDAALGVLQLTIPPGMTETFLPRGYVFDVELTRSSDGFRQTVIREVFNIVRDITTPTP